MEDDPWVGRGEVGHQQRGGMIAGQRGESLTSSRMGGRCPLGERGEDGRWVERGEFDHQQCDCVSRNKFEELKMYDA